MQAQIDLKVTGVRGGVPSWTENKGRVVTFVDSRDNYIAVDAFEGHGDTYKKRSESLVEVHFGNETWNGTMSELAKLLNLIK